MDQLSLAVALIFFPGLMATIIADKLTYHSPKWGVFKYFKYSFVFGTLSYSFIELFLRLLQIFPQKITFLPEISGGLQVWDVIRGLKEPFSFLEIFLATMVSIIIGIIGVYAVEKKLIFKISQKVGLSHKYGDENLFSFFLNDKNLHWVFIRDYEANLVYEGRVVAFSEGENLQELVLSDVKMYNLKTRKLCGDLPRIYLSRPAGSFLIERAV